MKRLIALFAFVPCAAFAQAVPAPIAAAPVAAPLGAQTQKPGDDLFISGAEVARRVANADTIVASGAPDTGPFHLMDHGPFVIALDYSRGPSGHVNIHEHNAELFYVLAGTGELTMGGELVNPKRQGTDIAAATAIGGRVYKLAKGDIILVPPGMSHQVTKAGPRLAMMSVHVPLAEYEAWPHNTRSALKPVAIPDRATRKKH